MSLINDALKKAARQRAQESNAVPPMPGSAGYVQSAGQGGPMSTQTMVLIGGAALVIIVVSAVVTGMLIAGKFDSKRPAPVAAAEVRPAAPATAPAPAIAISVPKAVPAAVVVASPPVVTPAPVAAAEPTPAPVAPAPAPKPVAAAALAPATAVPNTQAQNDAIQTMIDKFHVSGVRASGTDSKALIDGHVYKVNDFLDRSLGLKLTEVAQDHLTFTTREGTTFTKTF